MNFLLDSDAEIGDNKHTSEVSDMSLRKVDTIHGTKEKIYALCAKAGGKRTSECLAKEFSLVDHAISLMDL